MAPVCPGWEIHAGRRLKIRLERKMTRANPKRDIEVPFTDRDIDLCRSRPGDLFFMSQRIAPGEDKLLLKIAKHLRNLMAYPGATQVLKRLLEAAPNHVTALEQKALCLMRMGRQNRQEAEDDLKRSLTLLKKRREVDIETLSILGRLSKERWRHAWYSEADALSDSEIARKREQAAEKSFYLCAAIDYYEKAFRRTEQYYEAINVMTLMALALHLDNCFPNCLPRPRARMSGLWDEFESKVEGIIAGTETPGDNKESLYWVQATRLELELIKNEEDPGTRKREEMEALTNDVVRCAGRWRFLLDSTVQQFRLFRCLGFRPGQCLPILEKLERALDLTPDPSRPRGRVVYAGCCTDSHGNIKVMTPGEFSFFDGKQASSTLERIKKRETDILAYISPATPGGVEVAEICKTLRVPYDLYMPFGDDRMIPEYSGLLGPDWASRFIKIRTKARDIKIIPPYFNEARDEKTVYSRLLSWMFSWGSVYGVSNMTLIVFEDEKACELRASSSILEPEKFAAPIPVSGPKRRTESDVTAVEARKFERVPTTPVKSSGRKVNYFFKNIFTADAIARWRGYSPLFTRFSQIPGRNMGAFRAWLAGSIRQSDKGIRVAGQGTGGNELPPAH